MRRQAEDKGGEAWLGSRPASTASGLCALLESPLRPPRSVGTPPPPLYEHHHRRPAVLGPASPRACTWSEAGTRSASDGRDVEMTACAWSMSST